MPEKAAENVLERLLSYSSTDEVDFEDVVFSVSLKSLYVFLLPHADTDTSIIVHNTIASAFFNALLIVFIRPFIF